MTAATVVAVLLSLVPVRAQTLHGERIEDARQRYDTIARAVVLASGGDRTTARYLLTIARHESSLLRSVHTGARRGDGGQSWGLWQEMVGVHPSTLVRGQHRLRARDLIGVSDKATLTAARLAAARVRFARKRCRNSGPACVFAVYGGVRDRRDARIVARVRTYGKIAVWTR